MGKVIEDLECMVMWAGEPTIDQCINSINRQTYQAKNIKVIKDVFPLNASINRRHEKMEKKFSVKVDVDFILKENCFESLYRVMGEQGSKCYAVSGLVDDTFMGPIGGIHLERTTCVKDLKVLNIIGCDRFIQKEMKRRGYKFLEIGKVLAEHKVDWSWQNVFTRYFRLGQKHAYYKTHRHQDYIMPIGRKWLNGNKLAFLALVGYCHGLFVYDDKEKDRGFGEEELKEIKKLIKSKVIPL